MNQNKKAPSYKRILPIILVIGGVVGLIASFVILHDKLHLLSNPNYKPSCSINPVISCGNIMQSAQSHAFGFPNPIIGLIAFPIVLTIGMAMYAGASFKRWFWQGFEAGTVFGVGFITWLFLQSVYHIQALCLYCMIVWSVTIPIFWYTTLYNLDEGNIKIPGSLKSFVGFIQRHHVDILVVWYLIIIMLILNHFWYYWSTIV